MLDAFLLPSPAAGVVFAKTRSGAAASLRQFLFIYRAGAFQGVSPRAREQGDAEALPRTAGGADLAQKSGGGGERGN